mmetsp:Transcript_9347/g.20408  ORF Transcript_9347/g.20408 Transcript_9347/m.20408 type:complete len:288 (-) Transcript_9347:1987-2850(-)
MDNNRRNVHWLYLSPIDCKQLHVMSSDTDVHTIHLIHQSEHADTVALTVLDFVPGVRVVLATISEHPIECHPVNRRAQRIPRLPIMDEACLRLMPRIGNLHQKFGIVHVRSRVSGRVNDKGPLQAFRSHQPIARSSVKMRSSWSGDKFVRLIVLGWQRRLGNISCPISPWRPGQGQAVPVNRNTFCEPPVLHLNRHLVPLLHLKLRARKRTIGQHHSRSNFGLQLVGTQTLRKPSVTFASWPLVVHNPIHHLERRCCCRRVSRGRVAPPVHRATSTCGSVMGNRRLL